MVRPGRASVILVCAELLAPGLDGHPHSDRGFLLARLLRACFPRQLSIDADRSSAIPLVHHARRSCGSACVRSAGGRRSIVLSSSGEDRPGNPGKLVGQRDGCDILVRPPVQIMEPDPNPVPCPISVQTETPRAVNEQASEICVPALCDPAEPRLAACRHLSGHKAEPGGEIPTAPESRSIGNRGDRGIWHEECRCLRAWTRPRS